MAKQAEEARKHLAEAEQALKPSYWSLKFSPDYMIASMEYSQAATKFRGAGLLEESVQAWVKAAEAKEQQKDIFGAGRAYESAAAICDGGGPGGGEAASAHWNKAIRCFRLSDKGELAAKLILKVAAYKESKGDKEGTKAAYEEVIEVYEQDEKDYNLGDVFKQYIGFLVRSSLFEDAMRVIDANIAHLARGQNASFIHKEILSKVVLMLHLQDTVRAEEALNPPSDVPGWYSSKECRAGSELVEAFRENDGEAADRIKKEQVFTFLHVELARLARQLQVAVPAARASAPASGPRAGGQGGTDGPAVAPDSSGQQAATVEEIADMLA